MLIIVNALFSIPVPWDWCVGGTLPSLPLNTSECPSAVRGGTLTSRDAVPRVSWWRRRLFTELICGFVWIFRNNRTCLRSFVRPMPDVLFLFTRKIHTRVPQGSLDRVCLWSLLLQFTQLICVLLLLFFLKSIYFCVCVCLFCLFCF